MNEITRRGFILGAATAAACGLLVGVERVCLSAFADNAEPEDDAGPVKIVKFANDGARLGIYTLAKVRKNKSEWKKQLTPLQYDGRGVRRPNSLFPVRSTINTRWGYTAAWIAAARSLIQKRNSTPVRVGRAFGKPSPQKMCARKKISARACCERKLNARCATRIWDMCSLTGPSRPACATA
jgi:hypothetical protein